MQLLLLTTLLLAPAPGSSVSAAAAREDPAGEAGEAGWSPRGHIPTRGTPWGRWAAPPAPPKGRTPDSGLRTPNPEAGWPGCPGSRAPFRRDGCLPYGAMEQVLVLRLCREGLSRPQGEGLWSRGPLWPGVWQNRGHVSEKGPLREEQTIRCRRAVGTPSVAVPSCPRGARDFRAQQCSELDGTEFRGRRYTWLPYLGAPNKCELNCIPKGENFYYRHREAVVDGTPCEPGRPNICVDGSCRAVGCDHELDSAKQEDKCLQCGGDGSTCYRIAGTLNASGLSRGYSQILRIPVGATSIRIEEAAASRNFLAVRSILGEYYLNGHWAIESAGALPAAGTVLLYQRGMEGDQVPERLWARGPTSEPLVIELLSQEPHLGVYYEYFLPPSAQPGHSWSHSSWSNCSAQCGGGHQTRRVFCTMDHEACPDQMCQHQPRPADRRPCNPHPCPQIRRWKTGSWGSCSAPCGGGSQYRAVYCVSNESGIQEAVEEAECTGLPGKPPTVQPCNLHHCMAWSPGPWGECSVSCGVGVRRRSVTCHRIEGSLPQATVCSLEDQPPATEPCVREDCAPRSGQSWHIGAWGPCSRSCGLGMRRRQVSCAQGLDRCGSQLSTRPADTEPCNTQPCHRPQGEDPGRPADPLHPLQPYPGLPASHASLSLCFPPLKVAPFPTHLPLQHAALPGQRVKPALDSWSGSRPTLSSFLHPPTEVSSVQDTPTQPLDPHQLPASGEGLGAAPIQAPLPSYSRDPWAGQVLPQAQDGLLGELSPHLLGPGAAPSVWQAPHTQQLPSGSGPRDCRHSPHGCCPDGHTASLGPQWQGCPGTPCQQSRNPRGPDIWVSEVSTPSAWGCKGSASRCGATTGPVAVEPPDAHRPQAQQSEPSDCRGSRFGCCYDNVASAVGPLGEGCVEQPSQAYPVRCLLPSAHGPCTDWVARWFFIASVARCNRFWFGGCHGNANNFASEQECEGSCRGSHTGGGRPPPQPSRPKTAAMDPGPREASLAPALAERLWSQELRPGAAGLGGDAGGLSPPTHSPAYRKSVVGSEPTLVQAALGQRVQLFCPEDTSPEGQAAWQKDGQPVSSDRHKLQSDGSLVIYSLRVEDTGTYSCASSGPGPGPDSHKIHLRIIEGDTAMLSETDLRHHLLIKDTAQGHGPSDSGTEGDAGGLGSVYVSSSHPRTETRLRLDWTQPGVVDASPGQQIRLPCRAEGFPPPSVEWQRDGRPISSPRHHPLPDGSLVIHRVAVEDGGFYACVAFNGQDRDQRWVQLRVQGELTITGLPPSVVVPEGDTARLLCVVTGEHVNIRWSRNGLPVWADGRHVRQSPDGTLLIYNLQAGDEGSYTCSAYRGSQAVSRSTEVKLVQPAPAAQPRNLGQECADQPERANCELILQAQLCGNEYYASFCCASCSRFQPPAQPTWQQG
ncbi:papilin [Carlito syrichta]|uniref:Papilin n=1 Tax=Carlito syrichta TaxID=1868482 RepID=A0A3Q0EIE9_CARSF|nr:papilin [Carlito syrichta]